MMRNVALITFILIGLLSDVFSVEDAKGLQADNTAIYKGYTLLNNYR